MASNKVLRIQHVKDKSGPFVSDNPYVRNIVDNVKLPAPHQDKGFGEDAVNRLRDEKASPIKFAFKDKDQMNRTFSDDHLATLKQHGYEPAWEDAKDTWHSDRQVMYTTHEGDKKHADKQATLKANTKYKEYSPEEIKSMNMKKTFIDKLIALNELLELREDLMKGLLTPAEQARQKHLEQKMKTTSKDSAKREEAVEYKEKAKANPNTKEAYKAPKKDFKGAPPKREGDYHGESHTQQYVNGHRKVIGVYEDKSGERKGSARLMDNRINVTHTWDHKSKKWNHSKTEHTLGGLNVDGTKKKAKSTSNVSVSDEEKKKYEQKMNEGAKKKKAQDAAKYGTTTKLSSQKKEDKSKSKTVRRKKSDVDKVQAIRNRLQEIKSGKLKKADELEGRLEELKKAMKLGGIGGQGAVKLGAVLPSIKIKSPSNNSSTPSTGIAQASKKNPIKSAEQTQNKDIKDIKLREAQDTLKKPEMAKKEDDPHKDYHVHRSFFDPAETGMAGYQVHHKGKHIGQVTEDTDTGKYKAHDIDDKTHPHEHIFEHINKLDRKYGMHWPSETDAKHGKKEE